MTTESGPLGLGAKTKKKKPKKKVLTSRRLPTLFFFYYFSSLLFQRWRTWMSAYMGVVCNERWY